jgi:hypothetical protein
VLSLRKTEIRDGRLGGNLTVVGQVSNPVLLTMLPRSDWYIPPCIPTRAAKPPAGPDWVHEIKHDGYRLIVRRDGIVVRLFTRNGYHWTEPYPAIAATGCGSQFTGTVFMPLNTNFWMRLPSWTSVT